MPTAVPFWRRMAEQIRSGGHPVERGVERSRDGGNVGGRGEAHGAAGVGDVDPHVQELPTKLRGADVGGF